MAEETIDKAIKAGFILKRKCVTSTLKLISDENSCNNERFKFYGDKAREIDQRIGEKP